MTNDEKLAEVENVLINSLEGQSYKMLKTNLELLLLVEQIKAIKLSEDKIKDF